MRELIGVSELLKEVYSMVLKYSKVHNEYRTIYKTFGTVSQYIAHEDNRARIQFTTVPKISPRTKHIATPYHSFWTNIERLEIKVAAVSTDNQPADQFTKVLPEQKFCRDRFFLMRW